MRVSQRSEREDATFKHTPTSSDTHTHTHTFGRKGWGFIRSHTHRRAHSCDGNVSYGATSPPLKPLILRRGVESLTHTIFLFLWLCGIWCSALMIGFRNIKAKWTLVCNNALLFIDAVSPLFSPLCLGICVSGIGVRVYVPAWAHSVGVRNACVLSPLQL